MAHIPAQGTLCKGQRKRRRNSPNGFTLIEIVITIVLLGLLGGVGVTMLYDGFSTADIVNTANVDATKARYAVERISRELREMKWAGDLSTGAYCVTTLSATTVEFRAADAGSIDVSACSTESTAVTIEFAGGAVVLTKGGASTLVNNVSSGGFTYHDIAGGTPTAASLASIVIQLSVSDSGSGQVISERTRVFLRNSG